MNYNNPLVRRNFLLQSSNGESYTGSRNSEESPFLLILFPGILYTTPVLKSTSLGDGIPQFLRTMVASRVVSRSEGTDPEFQ